MEYDLFEKHKEQCPWSAKQDKEDVCTGDLSHNGHVNAPFYGPCEYDMCPIYYWLNVIKEAEEED